MQADVQSAKGNGPPVFRVHGAIYCRVGSMLPEERKQSGFLSIYVHDTDHELQNRAFHTTDQTARTLRVLEKLQTMMHSCSPYVSALKNGYDVMKSSSHEMCFVLKADKRPSGAHTRTKNAPTASQVAVIIPGTDEELSRLKTTDVVIHLKSGGLRTIPTTNQHCDAMVYPLLFPYGDAGWSCNLEQNTDKRKTVSLREFAAHRLMYRISGTDCKHNASGVQHSTSVLEAGRLFQQFAGDLFSRVEQQRLNWIDHNQSELRIDLFCGLSDAHREGMRILPLISTDEVRENLIIGYVSKIVL
jgi:hypothetical protein